MDIALSLMVLTSAALVVGAFFLFKRQKVRQAMLMLLLAAVMATNVAIWTVPTQEGVSLKSSVPQGL